MKKPHPQPSPPTTSTVLSSATPGRAWRFHWARLAVGGLTCSVAMYCPVFGAGTVDAATAQAYREGVAAYRAGRTEDSYQLLRRAYLANPTDVHYRNDYLAAAVGDGHADEALQLAQTLDVNALPAYTLEALGRGARDLHQPDLAIRYYDVILASNDDVGARVGRDLALIDRGNAKEAQADLQDLHARYPARVDVLEALGLADEKLNRTIDALACAEAILKQDPKHVGALKLRYRMLVQTGAPQLALATTPKDLVSAEQQHSALRDELAFAFRWARDEPVDDVTRAKNLDAVIQRMQDAIATARSEGDRDLENGLRGDLVEALAERGRSQEAVDEYQKMQADGIAIEPYVKGAVAAAYVAIKQPQAAMDVFRSLPDQDAASYGTRASYFYALLESDHYDEAVAWADHLAASEPMYTYSGFPELKTANDNYTKALVLSGLARTFTDRLAEGQTRLETLAEEAPANDDIKLALAMTYELRGWPRQAADTARLAGQDDPDATAPLAQIFADQLDMNAWHGAEATLGQLQARLPSDDQDLLSAQRAWAIHNMPEVVIDGHLGQSHGGRDGVIDSEIDEYVYSSPIDYNYRAYLHLNQAEGDPIQGDVYRHAAGVGVEYTSIDWLATGELLDIDSSGPHPQGTLYWTPDDQWKIGGAYAVRTLDLPIAALVVGDYANRLALDVTYRVSESREFGVEAVGENFSDSNQRRELDGYWRERWITGPVYKLDTRLDLDTSANTLDNTNYFNPRRDFSGTVTFENMWQQFRHYDNALSHEFDFGVGNYWERNYGDGVVALARYQLVYEVNDRLTIKAGVGRSIRPFDGQRERLDQVLFNLDGRF